MTEGDEMEPWFTVEKIDSDTFAISEYRHWEETHCYLLCGTECAVLVDTGLGVANIRDVVDGLTRLPVLAVTTHVHWDHIGGHGYFEHIAVHERERAWLESGFPIPLETVKRSLTCKPCDFPEGFTVDEYHIFQGKPQRILRGGDCLSLGNRRLKVIHTPGHSPGHCCFYEPEREYLFTGDLVYRGCLDAFYPTTDPEMFLRSLEKIKSLNVSRVLPGHHRLNIPAESIGEVERCFRKLSEEGKLVQGNGIFDFGEYQIHI